MILFFDVEVSIESKKIKDYGGVLVKKRNTKEEHTGDIKSFIKLAKKASFYCGHNIINHDIKFINQKLGYVLIEPKKSIDTLYWSALMYPQKPYHNLVKNDKLLPEDSNNPLNDSKKALELYDNIVEKFYALSETKKQIYYGLLKDTIGYKAFFDVQEIQYEDVDIKRLIINEYMGLICEHAEFDTFIEQHPIELAYSLALVDTTPDSLFPAWVLKNYPYCETVMLSIRNTPCSEGCKYCQENLDAVGGLNRYFGYPSFRTFDGEALQENAVKAALSHKSLIAVFPTGGGKSLTYQIPALMTGENSRALTVIISPLQSLMKDQVDNLEDKSITKSATINGLLDPIERQVAIDRVRQGDVHILYLAPESLRSKTIENLLLERDIARIVIDEAHCFSAWGHDFRVDYLYIGDFIKNLENMKQNNKRIPVSCFTATAKQNVIKDIEAYFLKKLDIKMEKILAKTGRTNLTYKVFALENDEDKYKQLRLLIDQKESPVIVYASRRKLVEKIHDRLKHDGYNAHKFHGGMEIEEKIAEQDAFMSENIGVMVATNAFGMGVDKDDVGTVIHYDISDSLENYVQEAGRAGRNELMKADCYVLFHEDDLDKHFTMLNHSRIHMKEIQQVWSAIKNITRSRKSVSQSALEIARKAGWDDSVNEIQTRVTTAIAALEDSGYVKRKHNSPRVFANSIMVDTFIQAEALIEKSNIFEDDYEKLNAIRISKSLISSKHVKQVSDEVAETRVDYLSDHLGLTKTQVFRTIAKLREIKVLADLKDLACYVKKNAKQNLSKNILSKSLKLERFILESLTEEDSIVQLKSLNEQALNNDIDSSLKVIKRIVNYLEIVRLIDVKKVKIDTIKIKPRKSIEDLLSLHESRVMLADFIIDYIFTRAETKPEDDETEKILFSVNELKDAFNSKLQLFGKNATLVDVEETLYFLQKVDAIKLEGGFLVTYNPMNLVRIEEDTRKRYTKNDYEKLENFYKQKVHQIHIVGEYAKKMIEDYQDALNFVDDYFKMSYTDFLDKHFKGARKKILDEKLSKSKMELLFSKLSPTQLSIVKDNENSKVVVAAGPGSGKTMLLVHKLATILFTEDIRSEQLLMLTFSRAAVSEFKERLYNLIGPSAKYIDIKTFHSYAFDILGRPGNLDSTENVIEEAIKEINENNIDESKITKMVLVIDEAQDMDKHEFELINTLMKRNEDLRVIAVGDDDQNIYEFRGSSSAYMASFIKAGAKKYELPTNYRSTKNLVAFTNHFVKTINNRLKSIPIEAIDNTLGSIEVYQHKSENIEVPIVKHIINTLSDESVCVLTRNNNEAMQITGLLNKHGHEAKLIQSTMNIKLTNMKEVRTFLSLVSNDGYSTVIAKEKWQKAIKTFHNEHANSSHISVLSKVFLQFDKENKDTKYLSDLNEFLIESNYEDFIETKKIIVSTLHKAKGREFDTVFIAYKKSYISTDEDKRLLYVGMTRAMKKLIVHYTGDFLKDIEAENLKYAKVDKEYDSPDRLVFQLSYKDVNLGYFKYTQNTVHTIASGESLQIQDSEYLTYNGKKVLKFSKAYATEIENIKNQGFTFTKASVKFLLYWYDPNEEQEYLVVIPELVFDKAEMTDKE